MIYKHDCFIKDRQSDISVADKRQDSSLRTFLFAGSPSSSILTTTRSFSPVSRSAVGLEKRGRRHVDSQVGHVDVTRS